MSIHERYVRDSALAVSELRKHKYVEYDEAIAAELFKIGSLLEFKQGSILIEQGATDQFIYLILSGSAQIIINGNELDYLRSETDAVGEMTILNPSAPRLATIKANTDMSVLRIDYLEFKKILDTHPKMYISLLRDMTSKIKQRNQHLREVNKIPKLFIISSVESLPVAESILCNLEHVEVEVQLWSDSHRFDAGSNVLNVLEEHVKQSDFSLAIFSDDDVVTSRGDSLKAPRDNVVLELGMFLGRLGKERAFYVLPKDVNVKVPTDFNGITPLKYSKNTSGEIDTRILVAGLKAKFSKLGVMKNI